MQNIRNAKIDQLDFFADQYKVELKSGQSGGERSDTAEVGAS